MRYSFYYGIIVNMLRRANVGKIANQHFAQAGFLFGFKLCYSPVIEYENGFSRLKDDPPSRYTPIINAGAVLPDYFLGDGRTVYDIVDLSQYTLIVNIQKLDTSSPLLVDFIAGEFRKAHMNVRVESISMPEADDLSPLRRKEVEVLYLAHQLIIVRPDLYVAWAVKQSFQPTKCQITRMVTTLTGAGGVQSNGDYEPLILKIFCQADAYIRSRREFFSQNMTPLVKQFPNAVPVWNMTKDEAVAKMKRSDKNFKATTKVEQPSSSSGAQSASLQA